MKPPVTIAALLIFCAAISVRAADNMKAYPPADEGMVRHVLQIPHLDDEST